MNALSELRDALEELTATIEQAVDLLDRQACNCLPAPEPRSKVKVRCLRCELLEILR